MTQMDLSFFLAQPWVFPSAAALGAFLLGFIIARLRNKGGTSWLSAFVFWPVSLLRDLLDAAHTKRLQYYMLLLTLIGMEVFFSFRAATVYYDILDTRMSGIEVGLVSSIAFAAVFLSGFIVASHGIKNAQGQTDKGNMWLAVLVVAHDFTGIVWFMYGASSASSPHDWTTVLSTIGMCAFSLIPFALGSRAAKLRPELEAELDQEVAEFTAQATRRIKRRAVDRVLHLAGRTDIIHLVRALPAGEFADFKQFVMPIIAPGVSHNLDETGAQNEQSVTAQPSAQSPHAQRSTSAQPSAQPRGAKQSTSAQLGVQVSTAQPVQSAQPGAQSQKQMRRLSAQPGVQGSAQDQGAQNQQSAPTAPGVPDTLEAARTQLRANPAISDRELGRLLGKAAATAKRYREQIEQEQMSTAQPLSAQGAQSVGAQFDAQPPAQVEHLSNGHEHHLEPTTDKMSTVVLAEEELEVRQN